MSVAEAQSKVTSWEFLGWMAYFEREFQVREKQDFYLAQIAQVIYNVNVTKKGHTKKLDAFLLKFRNRVLVKKKKMSWKKKMEWSKSIWLGAVGYKAKPE